MAAMMWMIININNDIMCIIKIYYHQHHSSHFMAATFDCTTFSSRFLEGCTLRLHSLYTLWVFIVVVVVVFFVDFSSFCILNIYLKQTINWL